MAFSIRGTISFVAGQHSPKNSHGRLSSGWRSFGKKWCSEYEAHPPYQARVRVASESLPLLVQYVGGRVRGQVTRSHILDADGWVTLDLPFESFNEARTHLLGLGRAVEVLEPETLRKSLIDFAEQIIIFYEKKGRDEPAPI